MMETLYRVTLPYAVFGLVVRDGTIIAAAPIAKVRPGTPAAPVLARYGSAVEEVPDWAARKARARAFLAQSLKKGRPWASLDYAYDAPAGGAGREGDQCG